MDNNLGLILLLLILTVVIVIAVRNSKKEFIENSTSIINEYSSQSCWGGGKTFQVEVYCEKYDITSIFSVNEKFVLAFEEGMEVPVKIYKNRSDKYVQALDFEKMNNVI